VENYYFFQTVYNKKVQNNLVKSGIADRCATW